MLDLYTFLWVAPAPIFFSLFACGGWSLFCFSLWRVHHIFIILLVYYLTYFCSYFTLWKKNLPSSNLVFTQCGIPKLRASEHLINFLSHQFFQNNQAFVLYTLTLKLWLEWIQLILYTYFAVTFVRDVQASCHLTWFMQNDQFVTMCWPRTILL